MPAARRLRSVVWSIGSMLVALAAWPGAPTNAQDAEARTVMVDLGVADGPVGETLAIPVNIAVPDGTIVTALEMDVRFNKSLLSFARVDLAPQGKADQVKLVTAVESDPSDSTQSILRLRATAPKALGTGAVADLFFQIARDAKAPTGSTGHQAARRSTMLKKVAKVRTGDGTLAPTGGRDGEIEITEGVALFGCFFYMH
jgi:hypothetical protein